MSKSQFDIKINNDGQVELTQKTSMTVEEYLQWAHQVYQYQVKLRGVSVSPFTIPKLGQDKN